jgi:hypothetical protein
LKRIGMKTSLFENDYRALVIGANDAIGRAFASA